MKNSDQFKEDCNQSIEIRQAIFDLIESKNCHSRSEIINLLTSETLNNKEKEMKKFFEMYFQLDANDKNKLSYTLNRSKCNQALIHILKRLQILKGKDIQCDWIETIKNMKTIFEFVRSSAPGAIKHCLVAIDPRF